MSAGTQPTYAELLAKVQQLEAEAAAKANTKLTIKIAEKGGISVYGLGRFPVTLYFEQWERLLAFGESIRGFIKANRSQLKTKAEAKATEKGE